MEIRYFEEESRLWDHVGKIRVGVGIDREAGTDRMDLGTAERDQTKSE